MAFRDALTKRIVTLPAQLPRSITWDQGPEMSEHVRFSINTKALGFHDTK